MQKLFSTPTHDHFLSYFQGIPVRICRDRQSGEVLFDAESVAECLGYPSAEAMMSDDIVLDALSDCIKTEGQSPIRHLTPTL